jgi:hypothetical protein
MLLRDIDGNRQRARWSGAARLFFLGGGDGLVLLVGCDSLTTERAKNDLLGLTHDGIKVFGAF